MTPLGGVPEPHSPNAYKRGIDIAVNADRRGPRAMVNRSPWPWIQELPHPDSGHVPRPVRRDSALQGAKALGRRVMVARLVAEGADASSLIRPRQAGSEALAAFGVG